MRGAWESRADPLLLSAQLVCLLPPLLFPFSPPPEFPLRRLAPCAFLSQGWGQPPAAPLPTRPSARTSSADSPGEVLPRLGPASAPPALGDGLLLYPREVLSSEAVARLQLVIRSLQRATSWRLLGQGPASGVVLGVGCSCISPRKPWTLPTPLLPATWPL